MLLGLGTMNGGAGGNKNAVVKRVRSVQDLNIAALVDSVSL